jgi:hypothetical protein
MSDLPPAFLLLGKTLFRVYRSEYLNINRKMYVGFYEH